MCVGVLCTPRESERRELESRDSGEGKGDGATGGRCGGGSTRGRRGARERGLGAGVQGGPGLWANLGPGSSRAPGCPAPAAPLGTGTDRRGRCGYPFTAWVQGNIYASVSLRLDSVSISRLYFATLDALGSYVLLELCPTSALGGHLEASGHAAADLGQVISLAESERELSGLAVRRFQARRREGGVRRSRCSGPRGGRRQFRPQPEDGAHGPAAAPWEELGSPVGQAAKGAPGT